MIVDIQTSTQSFTDGIPTFTWKYKETRVINWSPIGWEARMQMGVAAGGELYPSDSRAWLEHNANVVVGNRFSYSSGTTYYEVLSVFSYEDHVEAELRKMANG